jgi:hypothetical protein
MLAKKAQSTIDIAAFYNTLTVCTDVKCLWTVTAIDTGRFAVACQRRRSGGRRLLS